MDKRTKYNRTVADLFTQRLLTAEGYLNPDSIMSLLGCNRSEANLIIDMHEESELERVA